MKLLATLCAGLMLCGCGSRTVWIERYEPTTDAERQAIAQHVECILTPPPTTLSGHDQDWELAIAQAHAEARHSLCRSTYWEWQVDSFLDGGNGRFTGKWRYAEEVP